MKKQQRRPSRPGEPYTRPDAGSFSDGGSQSSAYTGGERAATDVERQLIGSLIDSYGFKQDGLVKKTMSVTVQGVTHHLVSYYNVNDVIQNNLRTPSQTDNLQYIRPRAELTSKQSFRSPIEDVDELDAGPAPYGYRVNNQAYIPDYKQQQPYYMPPNYQSMNQQQPQAARRIPWVSQPSEVLTCLRQSRPHTSNPTAMNIASTIRRHTVEAMNL